MKFFLYLILWDTHHFGGGPIEVDNNFICEILECNPVFILEFTDCELMSLHHDDIDKITELIRHSYLLKPLHLHTQLPYCSGSTTTTVNMLHY